MNTTEATLDEVKVLVANVLGITDRLESMRASTELLGSLPELDSMAIVELLTAMEERFGFEVDEADVTTDVFETLGTLADFVEENRS